MRHLKTFESYQNEETNEGLKDIVIGGLIALSSIGAAKSQDLDTKVTSPTTRTEYQIHQSQLDNEVQSKLVNYYKLIKSNIKDSKKTQEGKYTVTKGSNFTATSKGSSGYSQKSVMIAFGTESKIDGELHITLKDDGIISVIADDVIKKTTDRGFGGVIKKGTKVMDQTEIRKGDVGYGEALGILNLF
jgi:hypothetical protein